MVEIWKDIKGYEGLYRVSNTGKVFSYKSNRELHANTHGYLVVGLTKDKKQRHKYIHRLVAEAFLPNPKNKPEVNHIDHNTHNNHVTNLEWVTPTENKLKYIKSNKYKAIKEKRK